MSNLSPSRSDPDTRWVWDVWILDVGGGSYKETWHCTSADARAEGRRYEKEHPGSAVHAYARRKK